MDPTDSSATRCISRTYLQTSGTTYRNGILLRSFLVLVGWMSLVYRIHAEERMLSQHAEWPPT